MLAFASRADHHLAFVRVVYQHARRGSKAVIVWHRSGQSHDTWFERWQARAGVYVVVAGGVGWGPHNRNSVFYVRPGGVVAVAPGNAPAAWRRHQERLARRQARRVKKEGRSFEGVQRERPRRAGTSAVNPLH